MLDEDNTVSGTSKSFSAHSPDETTGAPQLERSTEVAETQTTTANSEVRNLRSHPFVTYSLFKERKDN